MVKSRSKVVVTVPKKQRKQRKQVILPRANANQLRFDPESNGLKQKMIGIQSGAASGDTGTQMLGTTGNYYLDSLCDPFRAPCRIPDDYVRPTALHQSFQYFTVNTDANGEVCIFLNPIWGNAGAFTAVGNHWVSTYAPTPGAGTSYPDPDLALMATGAGAIASGTRPVSAALLVSFIGNTLNDGGQISAAWIPGDTSAATLAALVAAGTNVQTCALLPGAYTGPLSKGAYTFWKPDDDNDIKFNTQAQQVARSFPMLVVCIKAPAAMNSIVRVSAVTNHELTTNSRVLDHQIGEVEPDLLLHARKVLSHFPTSCANDGHVSLWQRIQQGCKDFFLTVGQSFRNLFAPSLSDIASHSAAITPLIAAGMGLANGGQPKLTLEL